MSSTKKSCIQCTCTECKCTECTCADKKESLVTSKRPFYCYYGYYGYALTTLLSLATGYAAGRYVRSKL